ncbi:NAD-dependent DNA ligase LigA [Bdellovibrio sp. BCCA]|uniref:NAD-dependent DNA ligase LigA n=1 Tax=Bdellovibrio sp. BCCA TaxID=3136281 RepID=UPI0030F10B2B
MNFNEAKSRYSELVKVINRHNYNYYTLDAPSITDKEYDVLYAELLMLEQEFPELIEFDSPSRRVGGPVLSGFNKVVRDVPMLSLGNTYNVEELLDFLKKVGDRETVTEFKHDGLSMEIKYVGGFYHQAATRGDGTVGEDVTENVRTIKNLPLKIESLVGTGKTVTIRGEVVIDFASFDLINRQQAEKGEKIYANPRNLAAGSVRQLDSTIAAKRPLRFIAYQILEQDQFEQQDEVLSTLAEYGFQTTINTPLVKLPLVTKDPNKIIEIYNLLQKVRAELPFPIDGLTVKVNKLKEQEELGMISKSPKWATALKFEPEEIVTKVLDIIVQVGRTGALTPVAILDPVPVGGVTVERATLHNQSEIDAMGVRIGGYVAIRRSGDVIPEVVRYLPERSCPILKVYKMKPECPECGSVAVRPEGEAIIRCTNNKCTGVVVASLAHYVSRKGMNIDKVGERLIEVLVRKGLVKKPSDLYKLSEEQLLTLEKQGKKSVENILKNIKSTKKHTLWQFIHAMGIRHVGESTSKDLAKTFKTVEGFLLGASRAEELAKIPDVGVVMQESISRTVSSVDFQEEVREIIKNGVQIEEMVERIGGPLSGKTFLITGTLPIKRDAAKAVIEEAGGSVLGSVSNKLNFLIVGDDPGDKVEKAKSKGAVVLNWDGVLKMIAA